MYALNKADVPSVDVSVESDKENLRFELGIQYLAQKQFVLRRLFRRIRWVEIAHTDGFCN